MSISNKQQALEAYFLDKFKRAVTYPGKLSIGVEHEFFVTDGSGVPANLDQSQNFLRRLSEVPGWKIFKSEFNKELQQEVVLRVSKEDNERGFTAVKYEYPSSLLEIASNYHFEIDSLKRDLYGSWEAIHAAANKSGCRILSTPFLRGATKNKNIAQLVDPVFKDLSESRRACFLQRNEAIDEEVVDFTCFTAATQIHVGGICWWEMPSFFESLYRAEEKLAHCSYKIAGWPAPESQVISRTRWEQYRQVFSRFRLLGFPDLKTWTFSEWVTALLESPLVIDTKGKPPISLEQMMGRGPIDTYIGKIRDLQIIKPKLIGTIEFRADPAMPGIDEIYNLSLLRLLQCQAILSPFHLKNSDPFSAIKDRWWHKMLVHQTPNSSSDMILTIMEELSSKLKQTDFRNLVKRIA